MTKFIRYFGQIVVQACLKYALDLVIISLFVSRLFVNPLDAVGSAWSLAHSAEILMSELSVISACRKTGREMRG